MTESLLNDDSVRESVTLSIGSVLYIMMVHIRQMNTHTCTQISHTCTETHTCTEEWWPITYVESGTSSLRSKKRVASKGECVQTRNSWGVTLSRRDTTSPELVLGSVREREREGEREGRPTVENEATAIYRTEKTSWCCLCVCLLEVICNQ